MKSKALSIVVLLLAVVLLGLLFVNHRQEQRQTAYMQQLQKEAMPYEQDINDIRLELAQKQRAINIEEDTSGILFGFVPASADDFTEIDKLAAEHSITPVILHRQTNADEPFRRRNALQYMPLLCGRSPRSWESGNAPSHSSKSTGRCSP